MTAPMTVYKMVYCFNAEDWRRSNVYKRMSNRAKGRKIKRLLWKLAERYELRGYEALRPVHIQEDCVTRRYDRW